MTKAHDLEAAGAEGPVFEPSFELPKIVHRYRAFQDTVSDLEDVFSADPTFESAFEFANALLALGDLQNEVEEAAQESYEACGEYDEEEFYIERILSLVGGMKCYMDFLVLKR